jgi:hypothetical protein
MNPTDQLPGNVLLMVLLALFFVVVFLAFLILPALGTWELARRTSDKKRDQWDGDEGEPNRLVREIRNGFWITLGILVVVCLLDRLLQGGLRLGTAGVLFLGLEQWGRAVGVAIGLCFVLPFLAVVAKGIWEDSDDVGSVLIFSLGIILGIFFAVDLFLFGNISWFHGVAIMVGGVLFGVMFLLVIGPGEKKHEYSERHFKWLVVSVLGSLVVLVRGIRGAPYLQTWQEGIQFGFHVLRWTLAPFENPILPALFLVVGGFWIRHRARTGFHELTLYIALWILLAWGPIIFIRSEQVLPGSMTLAHYEPEKSYSEYVLGLTEARLKNSHRIPMEKREAIFSDIFETILSSAEKIQTGGEYSNTPAGKEAKGAIEHEIIRTIRATFRWLDSPEREALLAKMLSAKPDGSIRPLAAVAAGQESSPAGMALLEQLIGEADSELDEEIWSDTLKVAATSAPNFRGSDAVRLLFEVLAQTRSAPGKDSYLVNGVLQSVSEAAVRLKSAESLAVLEGIIDRSVAMDRWKRSSLLSFCAERIGNLERGDAIKLAGKLLDQGTSSNSTEIIAEGLKVQLCEAPETTIRAVIPLAVSLNWMRDLGIACSDAAWFANGGDCGPLLGEIANAAGKNAPTLNRCLEIARHLSDKDAGPVLEGVLAAAIQAPSYRDEMKALLPEVIAIAVSMGPKEGGAVLERALDKEGVHKPDELLAQILDSNSNWSEPAGVQLICKILGKIMAAGEGLGSRGDFSEEIDDQSELLRRAGQSLVSSVIRSGTDGDGFLSQIEFRSYGTAERFSGGLEKLASTAADNATLEALLALMRLLPKPMPLLEAVLERIDRLNLPTAQKLALLQFATSESHQLPDRDVFIERCVRAATQRNDQLGLNFVLDSIIAPDDDGSMLRIAARSADSLFPADHAKLLGAVLEKSSYHQIEDKQRRVILQECLSGFDKLDKADSKGILFKIVTLSVNEPGLLAACAKKVPLIGPEGAINVLEAIVDGAVCLPNERRLSSRSYGLFAKSGKAQVLIPCAESCALLGGKQVVTAVEKIIRESGSVGDKDSQLAVLTAAAKASLTTDEPNQRQLISRIEEEIQSNEFSWFDARDLVSEIRQAKSKWEAPAVPVLGHPETVPRFEDPEGPSRPRLRNLLDIFKGMNPLQPGPKGGKRTEGLKKANSYQLNPLQPGSGAARERRA